MKVAQSAIDAFQLDGAVCLRQVLSEEDVALLRAGIDANLAAPSARAKLASRPDDPGRFIEDFCSWQETRSTAASYSSRRSRPSQALSCKAARYGSITITC